MGQIRAQSIFGNPKLSLSSIVDASLPAARSLAATYRVPFAFPSLTDAIKDDKAMEGVKGVVVCSPTDTHPEVFEVAAKRGLHIFTEKPGEWEW